MFALPKQFQFVSVPIIVTFSKHILTATGTIMVQKMLAFPKQFQFVFGPIIVIFSTHFCRKSTIVVQKMFAPLSSFNAFSVPL